VQPTVPVAPSVVLGNIPIVQPTETAAPNLTFVPEQIAPDLLPAPDLEPAPVADYPSRRHLLGAWPAAVWQQEPDPSPQRPVVSIPAERSSSPEPTSEIRLSLQDILMMDEIGNPDRLMRMMITEIVSRDNDQALNDAIRASMEHSAPPARPTHTALDLLGKMAKITEKADVPCTICLDSVVGDAHQTPCGHHFHRDCITQSLIQCSDLCPNCRQPIAVKKE